MKKNAHVPRILIVEDNSSIQRLAQEVITFERDFCVSVASNGEEAMQEVLDSEPFDVILTDMDMPIKDGATFIRKMQELSDPTKNKVPVIACTGNKEGLTLEEYKKMGFYDLFKKPIHYRALAKALEVHFKK